MLGLPKKKNRIPYSCGSRQLWEVTVALFEQFGGCEDGLEEAREKIC
jgi:hypothetical protein